MESFDYLPMAALVGERDHRGDLVPHFLCIHGGLGPKIKTLKDIEKLDHIQETPSSGRVITFSV